MFLSSALYLFLNGIKSILGNYRLMVFGYVELRELTLVFYLQFGEMKIFFDPTAIAEQGLVIHANVSFGELELTVPRTWEIDNHVSVFAGTVTEPQVISGEARTKVKLVGNVNFAEITIHYI